MESVGFDGYTYVLFQRFLLKFLSVFAIYEILAYSLDRWLYQLDPTVYKCTSIWVISLLCIYYMSDLRDKLKTDYYMLHVMSQDDKYILTVHTLEIQGISLLIQADRPLDVSPENLEDHLNRMLDFHGRVLSCVLIPDYNRLYKLEQERMYNLSRRAIFRHNKPAITLFASKQYLDDKDLRDKLDKIDYSIDQELTKEILSSTVGFVLLDSLSSVNYLRELLSGGYFSFRKAQSQSIMKRGDKLSI